jgi:hypothetical protein
MRALFVATALILVSASSVFGQGRQSQPDRGLMLEVAVRGYLDGGRMGSLAGDSAADKLESYVWADRTLCALGASDTIPSTTPFVGWHFTGTVLSESAGQMEVRLEWQRLWDNGARHPGGAGGSSTHRLRTGERIELDRVVATTTGRCGTVDARLEASIAPRAAYLMAGVRGGVPGGVARGVPGAIGSGSGAGAGRGGRGGAGGGGTTGGVSGGVPSGTAAGAASAGAAGGRGAGGGRGSAVGSGAGQGTLQGGYFRGRGGILGNSYDAELWLVHKSPGGAEVVQQQTVRFSGVSGSFSFPPVQVAGRGGDITLDITGRLQVMMGNRMDWTNYFGLAGKTAPGRGGLRSQSTPGAIAPATPDPSNPSPLIIVSIARRAFRKAPFVDTRGTTDMSIQIPQPNDVLSFELPPLQKATEDLLSGHVFSVRIRITPVK